MGQIISNSKRSVAARNPTNGSGLFKSFLPNEGEPGNRESHITAVGGWFKSSLQHELSPSVNESHITAV